MQLLTQTYRCHTVILYGSRARGQTTSTSDFDVFGVCKRGRKTRIAKKQDGKFWDVHIYPEKDLRKLGDHHFSWKYSRILYSVGPYGKRLMCRIENLTKRPFTPHPDYEIEVVKAWAQKQLERCRIHDIQGLYRRSEFQNALIEHYYFVRQKRFLGPKEGFAWLNDNDLKTFKLVHRSLKNPTNISYLKTAAEAVYQVKLI